MELIEQQEMDEFHGILRSKQLDITDFAFQEIDITDPKSDELYALQGCLTVTRKSNKREKQYVIGDGMSWVTLFKKDLEEGAFG
ncbi:MAG: transcriptional regulator [Pseudomonadota bacterium]